MSVTIANTELVDTFETWRLNTNLIATVLSNNAITVTRSGGANRGGLATGNAHVIGTFSATTIRANNISGGNTTVTAPLTVSSNVVFNGITVTINANTVFTGNVDFNTVGTDRIDFGDISRWRLTGGFDNQYLRVVGSDRVDFKYLEFRDISLITNSAPIILSGANSSYSSHGHSPELQFATADGESVVLYAANTTSGSPDLYVKLHDAAGDSEFVITDSANAELLSVDSLGNVNFAGNTLYSGAATFSNTVNFNGTVNLNGDVNVGDAAADSLNVVSTASLNGNTTIGNANTDWVRFVAEVDSDVVPYANTTYDLGQEYKRWQIVYANNVTANTVTLPGGDVQTQITNVQADALAFAIALG